MILIGGVHSHASCLVLEDLLADSLLFMDLTINCRGIFKWFKL